MTITPRLDTHGAVNLILTNGSHLTAEWGIDVKVGDTFTVYAQSTDEGTMGRLTACLPADFNLDRMVHYSVWPDSGMAGIGSSARWREGNDGIRESRVRSSSTAAISAPRGRIMPPPSVGHVQKKLSFAPPTAVRSTTAGRAAASPSTAASSVPNPLPCRKAILLL